MKSLSGSLFVCACALVLSVEGYPSRLKRETTSEAASTTTSSDSSSASSVPDSPSSSSTATESSSTTTPSSENNKNQFGFGAAAGIGGLRHSIGVGNFDAETRADNFAPWGAFAGINLGNGGRIGAGCSGLNCGVQLGHFVLGTPHLLGIGRNILRRQDGDGSVPEGKKGTDELTEKSDFHLSGAASNPEDLRLVFRDAFRGFHERISSFFRAPVTHFIKKHVHIDNSTESVVGAVKPAASEQQTYRIQLTPAKPALVVTDDKEQKQNQQENEVE